MDGFHDCPSCGKANSAWGDGFCGPCEEEYQSNQAAQVAEEISEVRANMAACGCEARHGESCMTCMRRYAKILSLQGNDAQAAMILNQ